MRYETRMGATGQLSALPITVILSISNQAEEPEGDMLKLAFPMILAVAAGLSLVVQQANLRAALSSAAWSGFMSYALGVICMVALALLLQDPLPSVATASRIPWFAWAGGVFGAIFIGLAIFLIPQLGAATFFALLIAGQMLGSIVFDHFGVLGLPVHPVGAIRIAGAVLLVAGVVLVRM
jgi:bacterial/archaeal transporter family-2 protein